ncbi:MAG: alpha/beta hydrolase-fold protein, partial [Anaerostipes hadrus]
DYGVDREIYLIGYSLAGLFALWTAYETDIFSAIASCSGSLWFEQWDEYVLHHQIKHESNIYLSLGGKEEKTKNPVMARVGDRTRTQEQILRNDPKVKHTTLEFNSGGHFADAQKRLAKAVKWLLECT